MAFVFIFDSISDLILKFSLNYNFCQFFDSFSFVSKFFSGSNFVMNLIFQKIISIIVSKMMAK